MSTLRITQLNWVIILFLFVLLSASSWNSWAADDRYTILRTNPGSFFHEGEAPRVPGKGWYALVQENEQSSLIAATVMSRRVQDDLVDGDDAPATGVEITARPPDALFYLKHRTLRAGRVPSVPIQNPDFLGIRHWEKQDLSFQDIEFNKHIYQLRILARGDLTTPESSGPFSLLLSVDGGNQITLLTDEIGDDRYIHIYWAGDLNHDGLLDFIVGNDRYNNAATCWYLSKKSQPVSYETVGCLYNQGC
jgi:hypothetical protein